MPSECNTYIALSGADRSRNYIGERFSPRCDDSLQPGFYRFQGAAGNRMPTSCLSRQRCNTDAPGWLNGAHPAVEEGVVYRDVCFHFSDNCCWWTRTIRVRNCGTYFLYYLDRPPHCSLRYCGNGVGKFNLPSSFLSFCFFWFTVSDTKQEDLRQTQMHIYIYIYIYIYRRLKVLPEPTKMKTKRITRIPSPDSVNDKN